MKPRSARKPRFRIRECSHNVARVCSAGSPKPDAWSHHCWLPGQFKCPCKMGSFRQYVFRHGTPIVLFWPETVVSTVWIGLVCWLARSHRILPAERCARTWTWRWIGRRASSPHCNNYMPDPRNERILRRARVHGRKPRCACWVCPSAMSHYGGCPFAICRESRRPVSRRLPCSSPGIVRDFSNPALPRSENQGDDPPGPTHTALASGSTADSSRNRWARGGNSSRDGPSLPREESREGCPDVAVCDRAPPRGRRVRLGAGSRGFHADGGRRSQRVRGPSALDAPTTPWSLPIRDRPRPQ